MNDLTLLLPEFLLAALAIAVLSADLGFPNRLNLMLPIMAVIGLIALFGFSLIFLWGTTDSLYGGSLVVDGYSVFFKAFAILLGIVVVLSSMEYVKRHLEHPGEYYGILLFTVLAMMLMAASGELLTAYISLELLSFGLYVLVSFDRYNPKSNEAGVKYILLGAFSSALLLYGISQIYGQLGTTRFKEISEVIMSLPDQNLGLQVGLVFLIAGLGFKVAAVPFHMWAPDVYEGAPVPVTAYLSVGSKAAAFVLVIRIFIEALLPAIEDWQIIMAVGAALTMMLGNIVAVVQTNIKRLLAYSSIGHVGYLLLGVAALASVDGNGDISVELSRLAISGILFHIVAYAIANMAAFLCIGTVYNISGKDGIEDFTGLAKRSPGMAMVMTAALFSLAGLPIFAGFTSKFYLFSVAAVQGLLWLAGIAIFTSLISLYYYLMVIRRMYIESTEDELPIQLPRLTSGLLAVLFLGIVLLGIYPAPLMEVIYYASDAVLSSESVVGLISN